MSLLKQGAIISVAALLLIACDTETYQPPSSVTLEDSSRFLQGVTEIGGHAADGVDYFGTPYFGDLSVDAPLIHLFHQGGGNGRGEYKPLVGWLNENGFRAIAWDLRAGGDTYGESNRTVKKLGSEKAEYCDAYADIENIVELSSSIAKDAPIIIWGSSYSGALVFQAAAKHPDIVDGVIAFSPASGGPLAQCRARDYLADVKAPAFVLRPASEMERESSQVQRDIFVAAGVEFAVVSDGVHGSSMLVDERTKHNMLAARALVMDWLKATTASYEN